MMQILSINIGQPRTVTHNGKDVQTGIYKEPVDGAVHAGQLGLDGDVQVDKRFHGGSDQAIYVFDHAYYSHWEAELGRTDFVFGQFGENLTATGLPDNEVCIGDRYQLGKIVVQVSHPRVPCFKLGIRMDDPSFVKAFHAYGHVGFYLRVIETGEISVGDEFTLSERDSNTMTVADVFRVMHLEKDDAAATKRAALLPSLSMEWREKLLNRL